MQRVRMYKMGLWSLALCVLLSAAHGQDPAPPTGTMWFEVESNAISFGMLEPGIEPLPKPLVMRVHSDRDWTLKLIPTPGLIIGTGASVPLDRLLWRPTSTGLFIPLDISGPLTIASGPPTERGGDLILLELLLRPETTDPVGQYRYNLRLLLSPTDPGNIPAAPPPSSGESNDETITVTANNPGIFLCTIDATTFDFGDVNVEGTDYGTANVLANGRNGNNTGGEYESAPGAINWLCSTLPSSIVNIALISTATDHVGGMDVNDLEVRIPPAAGGTAAGYQAFASGVNLISGMSVGIGANAAQGQLDLRLTVLDDDPTGINTWLVRLRAMGNP